MALTKIKLGKLISLSEDKNTDNLYSVDHVKGISIQKKFIETKADMEGVSLAPYLLVKPDDFAYVTVTSRNGEKITLAHNTTKDTYIVSSSYVVFRVARKDLLLSDYLFMYFNRPEFDRYARFNSWGSARETFDWDTMCDIEIELPDLPTQQKYVNIYNTLVANQQSYERGLDDLKLVCDGFIEDLENVSYNKIGNYIERNSYKNKTKILNKIQVKGFNNEGEFIQPMRLFSGDIATFKIIKKNCFVYNSRINSTIKKLSIALNEGEDVIVSPAYESFYIKNESELCPFYLYMLLQREKFAQKVLFNSFGSSTLVFGIVELSEVKIPVPDISLQLKIANLYRTYTNRKAINEKLKAQIKNICPILIRGSLEEARGTK